MLHAVGFKAEDFKKSQIGVASTWSMVTPCNMHIDQLAVHVAQGINCAGGKAVVFNTITVSDGISMGTEGMKYSLVSREVIADSIETVAGCEGFDGIVAIGGCDKNMPGCIMGLARLNRPGLQAALVALDASNGNVLALVGGADYRRSTYNRALRSRRSRDRRSSPSCTRRRCRTAIHRFPCCRISISSAHRGILTGSRATPKVIAPQN